MTTEPDPRVETAVRLIINETWPLASVHVRRSCADRILSAIDAATPRPKSGEIVVTDAMVDAALDAFYGESRRQPRRETMEGMRRAIQAALVVGPIVDPRNRAVEEVPDDAVAALLDVHYGRNNWRGSDDESTLRAAAKRDIAAAERARGIPQMLTALGQAANQFDFYARQHLAKTPPDEAKAKTNSEWAMTCRAALTNAWINTPATPANNGSRAPDPAPSDTTHEGAGAAGVDGEETEQCPACNSPHPELHPTMWRCGNSWHFNAPEPDHPASNLRELTDRVAALERSGMAKDALLKAVTGRCMIDEHGHRLLAPLLDAAFPPELEALWPPGGCLTPTSCKLRDVCLHLHGHGHSCPHASDGGGA